MEEAIKKLRLSYTSSELRLKKGTSLLLSPPLVGITAWFIIELIYLLKLLL
jgi:hypothetical protein